MRKLALLSALLAVPLLPMSASAEIVNLHLFPPAHDTTTITAPAVFEPTVQSAPIIEQNTMELPAVVAPGVTTTTTAVHAAAPLTDLQIRAVPDNLRSGAVVETTTSLPAVFDDGTVGATTSEQTFSAVIAPISLGSPILGLNAMDRLTDMMDQVSLGFSRGMLSSEQQTAFLSDRDRIAGMINSMSSDGLTLDEVNQIEVQLNILNQNISNGMRSI